MRPEMESPYDKNVSQMGLLPSLPKAGLSLKKL